jgi:hypothetical protein
MLKFICFSLFSLFLTQSTLFAQCASSFQVTSSNGYTVHVDIQILGVVPSQNPCTWGYNYNLQFEYDITFTGTNIPASLWTLQGNMPCGTSTNNFFDLPNNGGKGIATSMGNIWRSTPDCGTATPLSLACNTVRLSIQGPGINENALMTIDRDCEEGAAPLPVELISFSAARDGRVVNLDWITASEFNNDYFEVLKSTDGQQWETLARVAGSGTTTLSNSYSYQDNTIQNVQIVYYRLRQVDFDGTSTFSDIEAVEVGPIHFTLAPNPAQTFTSLHSTTKINSAEVQISDLTGRVIPSESIVQQAGEHVILINTSQLNQGVYRILIGGISEKLVIE